jgi:hypothetical protein
MAPGLPRIWALRRPGIYVLAVATEDDLRLDEHSIRCWSARR